MLRRILPLCAKCICSYTIYWVTYSNAASQGINHGPFVVASPATVPPQGGSHPAGTAEGC